MSHSYEHIEFRALLGVAQAIISECMKDTILARQSLKHLVQLTYCALKVHQRNILAFGHSPASEKMILTFGPYHGSRLDQAVDHRAAPRTGGLETDGIGNSACIYSTGVH